MADQYKQLSHTAESVDDLLYLAASHASDTTSHITETERQSWNGKADAAALASTNTTLNNLMLRFGGTLADKGLFLCGSRAGAEYSQIVAIPSNVDLNNKTYTEAGTYYIATTLPHQPDSLVPQLMFTVCLTTGQRSGSSVIVPYTGIQIIMTPAGKTYTRTYEYDSSNDRYTFGAWSTKADASALSSETSDRVAADTALQTAIDGKASSSDLTDETSAREAADTALQTALNGKADTAAVFGTGTLIPNDGDLFTLPVGKYYRNTNPTVIANIPGDLTVAFYCEIVNTIADNRRKIYLYPATVQTAGVFYTCLETGNGYGSWYKYSGEVVQ